MNSVILSGGDLGGTIVEWPEGETELALEGLIYRLEGEQAIYIGPFLVSTNL